MEKISWQTPEFDYHEKDVSWYYLVVILGAIFIGLAVWQKDFLFAIFLVIATAVVLFWGSEKPGVVTVTVSDEGVSINNRRIDMMSHFSGFALKDGGQDNPEWGKLLLRHKQRLHTATHIPVPQGRMGEVKKLLSAHLSEYEYEDSFMDELLRFLKF